MKVNSAMREKYGPWAVVAGGSIGLGKCYSEQLAAAGFNVVIIARHTGPLKETADAIRTQYGVEVREAPVDLGSEDVLAKLSPYYDDIDVGLLVYNACHSFIGRYMDESLDSKCETIAVNCRGPALLTSTFAEKFLKRPGFDGVKGGLLLQGSLAGFQGTSMTLTYAATKAFVTSLGEGLWRELTPLGIDVFVNIAGAVLTPNFKAGTPEAKWKDAFPSQPEDVAREALACMSTHSFEHIVGGGNKFAHFLAGHLMSRKSAVNFIAKNTENLYK
jgi:short-subunit dehydrogenase